MFFGLVLIFATLYLIWIDQCEFRRRFSFYVKQRWCDTVSQSTITFLYVVRCQWGVCPWPRLLAVTACNIAMVTNVSLSVPVSVHMPVACMCGGLV